MDGRSKLLAFHEQNLVVVSHESDQPAKRALADVEIRSVQSAPQQGSSDEAAGDAPAHSTRPPAHAPAASGVTAAPAPAASAAPTSNAALGRTTASGGTKIPPKATPAKQKAVSTPKRGEGANKRSADTTTKRSPDAPSKRGSEVAPRRNTESDWDYLLRVADKAGAEAVSTVATRGLPPGSLACGAGGFEVRSLDGVLPLPSHQSVANAMRKLARGEEQAANAALRHHDVSSVRAFCRLWHELWGVRRHSTRTTTAQNGKWHVAASGSHVRVEPTPADPVHTSRQVAVPPSLAGGSELDGASRQRVVEAAKKGARTAPLPGRLLLISAGSALKENGAHNSPYRLCH